MKHKRIYYILLQYCCAKLLFLVSDWWEAPADAIVIFVLVVVAYIAFVARVVWIELKSEKNFNRIMNVYVSSEKFHVPLVSMSACLCLYHMRVCEFLHPQCAMVEYIYFSLMKVHTRDSSKCSNFSMKNSTVNIHLPVQPSLSTKVICKVILCNRIQHILYKKNMYIYTHRIQSKF